MVIVEVDHGVLAVVGVAKMGASSMVEVEAVVIEAKEGRTAGRPEVVVVVKVAVVLLPNVLYADERRCLDTSLEEWPTTRPRTRT